MIGRSRKLIQSNKRVASVILNNKKNILPSSSRALFSTCTNTCSSSSSLASLDTYANRHNYQPENEHTKEMLKELGFSSLDELINTIVPKSILYGKNERIVLPFDQEGNKTVLNGES